jgi:hypothetical protein
MTTPRLIVQAGLILLAPFSARAQTTPAPLRFEVASVKIHDGDMHSIYDYSSSGPRATWFAYPASSLIAEAYDLKNY